MMSVKSRNFNIIVTGQIISLFGSAIQRFALSLYLLDITGSASIFATILAISMVPIIIFAPIAGMIADRANKRQVMIWLDVISACVVFGYFFYVSAGFESTAIIAGVMIALSAISTVYQATVTASLPVIVEKKQLMKANGIVYQVSSLANFLGPILAGIVYGLFGIHAILLVNAMSFLVSAFLECALRLPHQKQSSDKPIQQLFLDDMRASYQYLKHEQPFVLRMIMTAGLFNLFLVPIFSIGAPYIIKELFGFSSQVYGLSEGCIALGMIGGAFFIGLRPHSVSITNVHRILYGVCVAMCIMSVTLVLVQVDAANSLKQLVIFTLSGSMIMFVLGMANVVTNTYVQLETNTKMIGKVSAFGAAFATVCVPIGQVLFGVGLDIFADQASIVVIIFAIATFFVTLLVRQNSYRIQTKIKHKRV